MPRRGRDRSPLLSRASRIHAGTLPQVLPGEPARTAGARGGAPRRRRSGRRRGAPSSSLRGRRERVPGGGSGQLRRRSSASCLWPGASAAAQPARPRTRARLDVPARPAERAVGGCLHARRLHRGREVHPVGTASLGPRDAREREGALRCGHPRARACTRARTRRASRPRLVGLGAGGVRPRARARPAPRRRPRHRLSRSARRSSSIGSTSA